MWPCFLLSYRGVLLLPQVVLACPGWEMSSETARLASTPHSFEVREFVWSRGGLLVIAFEFHGSEVVVWSEEPLVRNAVSVLGCLEPALS